MVWWRHTRGMHGEKARLKAWGPRARAERTRNMRYMVVTLEVSQPEIIPTQLYTKCGKLRFESEIDR